MARRSLGHVELEWQCPTCGIRNPGSNRVCSGCGAPQPDHVEFQNPVSTDLIEDPDKLAQAAAGPDIHCPYCNARNRADATICVQCGGDLTQGAARAKGQVIGALQNDSAARISCRVCGTENPASAYTCTSCGAPIRATPGKTKPEPEKVKGGCSWVAIPAVLGVIALIIFGAIYFFTGTAETLNATVVEARWSRTIEVEALMPVSHEAWREDIPQNATLGACRQEVQRTVDDPVPNSREVCGTPFVVDAGTGFGEVVQDCQYEVLAEYCEYETLEWRRQDQVQLTGTGHDLRWPVIPLTDEHRAGAQSQTLQCVLTADGRTFTYRTTSEDIFADCNPGSQWMLELNRAGGISSIAPQ